MCGRTEAQRTLGVAAGCLGHVLAAGVQAPSGPGWRDPCGGLGGRGCGRPCSCGASPTGCTVRRRRRRRGAAPRAGSGRGWSGSACVRECARSGAASARPPLGPARSPRPGGPSRVRTPSPPPPPPPPFCELESVTGAGVAARPSGTDSSGWEKTPPLESGRSGGAPGRRTRAREPGPRRRARGWGAGLSAGKWETLLNRGSPLPPRRRGRLFTSFF